MKPGQRTCQRLSPVEEAALRAEVAEARTAAFTEAAAVCEAQIMRFLDDTALLPEEERVGYPPFWLMLVRNRILALRPQKGTAA